MSKDLFDARFEEARSIWIRGDQKIYASDLKNALHSLGITKGDVVMGHFDFKVIGKIGDIKDRNEFYGTILHAILSVIGEEGALIIPTYTYSFCNGQLFDVRNTKPAIGYWAEFAFKKYQENADGGLGLPIIRSDDPIFSCVGFGKKAKLVLEGLGTVCFGSDSVFGRLYEYNAKLIGFGFPFAVTYMHFVEKCYSTLKEPLKYRFDKEFSGKRIDENHRELQVIYTYYVRDLENSDYEFERIPAELESRSKLRKTTLGLGAVTLANAKDVYDVIFEMLDKDKFVLLTNQCKEALIQKHNLAPKR